MTTSRPTLRHIVWFAAIATAALFLPTGCAHHDPAPGPYFAGLNQTLRAAGVGHSVLLIDLDRLDHNLDAVKEHLKEPLSFRATEKSLPSIELLNYVLARTGSRRVMAFHWRFFKELLTGLPTDTDILVGKTLPIAGVAEVWSGLDEAQRAEAQKRLTWLVDSPRTLTELVDFGAAHGARLRVAVEIDLGVYRGGATNMTEFDAILAAIAAVGPAVTLVGLMGYDGHVPYVRVSGESRLGSMRRLFKKVEEQYGAFRQHLQRHYPQLAATCTLFDGGGSGTYRLYGPSSPVNDIALGSALLKPGEYDLPTLTEHEPALFIATPVLKKLHPARFPFRGILSTSQTIDGYIISGGGWSHEIVHPWGLAPYRRTSPNASLISNQSFLYGAAKPAIEPGDFVFFRPGEADAIFLFEEILLLRGGKLVGTWKPFRSRY